jgi:MoaA/NifB/PqqE/SkfB family radical SAM enzyme
MNNNQFLSKERATKQNRIWIRISNTCNNKCIFCLDSLSHNNTFISEKEVKRKIELGYKKGCENRVILSGGEASINPLFPEYIKYAKNI